MKSKKIVGLMSLFSLLGLVATSCGPTPGSSGSNPDSHPSETGPVVPTEKPDEVDIIFWSAQGQKAINALKDVGRDFVDLVYKNEGVKVKLDISYQGDYDAVAKKISKGYATGNTPTIAIAYPDNVAKFLLDEKNPGDFVVNLEKYMNNPDYGFGTDTYLGDQPNLDSKDFVSSFFEEGTKYYREGVYSLPYMKSSEVMFYNMTALTEVMALYKPEFNSSRDLITEYIENVTWDEFMNLCGFIEQNKDKITMPTYKYPAFYDSDANLFISKMFQNEIPYSSIDGEKGHIDYEEPANLTAAKEMVKELKAHYDDGKFTTKGIQGTYGSDSFKSGECIFTMGSTGGAGYNVPQGDDFELGMCKVPVSNDNPYFVSQGPTLCMLNSSILSATQNYWSTVYGWKFLKYITNPDINVRLCMTGSEGYVPVRNSAYTNQIYINYLGSNDPLAKVANIVIREIGDSYLNTATFKGSATLRVESGAILTNVFNGAKSIDQAFTDAINNSKTKM